MAYNYLGEQPELILLLVDCFKQCKDLSYLDLNINRNSLSEKDNLSILSQGLLSMISLSTLNWNLQYNNLGDNPDSLQILGQNLTKLSNYLEVLNLNLGNNEFSENSIEFLGKEFLLSPKLHTLHLDLSEQSQLDLAFLVISVEKFIHLHTLSLNLQGNQLGKIPGSISFLLQGIQVISNLKTLILNFSDNQLSLNEYKPLYQLSQGLQKLVFLEELGLVLEWNDLQKQIYHLKNFVKDLKFLNSLKRFKIDLQNNFIDDKIQQILKQQLKEENKNTLIQFLE